MDRLYLLNGVTALIVAGCAGTPEGASRSSLSDLPRASDPVPAEEVWDTSRTPTSAVVVVHVHPQVHLRPGIPNDPGAAATVARCQRAIFDNAVALARRGVTSIVGEGLYIRGSIRTPEPTRREILGHHAQHHDTLSAVIRLTGVEGIDVYGFERILSQEGLRSARTVSELLARGGRNLHADSVRYHLDFLELTAVIRSYQALLTAYSVARATGGTEVQLIIGAGHWKDLRSVVVGEVRTRAPIRLVRYDYSGACALP